MPVATWALTDVLKPLPLPPPADLFRDVVDRRAAIRVDAEGVTLQGLWGRTLEWDDIREIEITSRLDEAVDLLFDYLPVTRVPVLGELIGDVAQQGLTRAVECVAGGPLRWLRNRSGWTVARFHLHGDEEVDIKRLPSVVALLYPTMTDRVVEEARSRDIDIERRTP